MSTWLSSFSQSLDQWTGTSGSLGYICIVLAVYIGYHLTTTVMSSSATPKQSTPQHEEGEKEPLRNFTAQQLRHFNGELEDDGPNPQHKPVYLSVAGTVFDVSDGRNFYGPGGPYAAFAGRECGIALSKYAFDEQYLDIPVDRTQLNAGERMELDQWLEKFQYYRNYPLVGKLIFEMPDPHRIISREELAKYNGTLEAPIPEGYATPPIYIAVDQDVFDMSFGGVSFYGPGGPYHKLAGRDATRALATMRLDDEMFTTTGKEEPLNEKQSKTMNDWKKTFAERKMYPIVGKLAQT
ncbi:hypothetical protein FisN_6Lh033 [Fistulifera solaris]|uniref:Cytochrome b5 heme-binding domain-containing protein n=1 Tax=Fistulifera solaris TaxID=1519565 RepID=A0A1Z5KPV0_FISSO|nr:hypothetical protein FisN_6Lh033 [Fistulifera solaris]|eukprot:GAX28145.1 hypothetical protein FisN_6Lh033 [Fistulifera solaris]